MNIILTALIAAAMGGAGRVFTAPCAHGDVYSGGVLGACEGATSDIMKGDKS